MVKTEINGEQYISVEELRKEIRELRRGIDTLYKNFDESHRAMVQLAYQICGVKPFALAMGI